MNARSWRAVAVGLVSAICAATVLAVPSGVRALFQEGFPHAVHDGLFPTCTGCHAGVPTGDASRFYPGEEACTSCHDAEERGRVDPPSPAPYQTNLDFSHDGHVRAVGEDGLDCVRCHGAADAEARMEVGRARPDACLACHAHAAPSHLAEDRSCSTCHVPLAEARELSALRVAAFPVPEAHSTPEFLFTHDPADDEDRCATYHARESCTRCHANGESLAAVRALRPDDRVRQLAEGRSPAYPLPPSHRAHDWEWGHASAATAGDDGCASCHTRRSCAACHGDATLPAIEALPALPEGDPRGVRIEEVALLHPPGYALDHGPAAAADGACASCHERTTCESCHAGAETPPFHLRNFLERHGPEAYSAASDCASCHDTEVFCRSCHEGVGLGSAGRAGVTAHTSRPFWLVGHGMAARQGLQGCVTCHDQGDCATCHSASFGWRVNPHGPGFDPERARTANPFSCARCHRGGEVP